MAKVGQLIHADENAEEVEVGWRSYVNYIFYTKYWICFVIAILLQITFNYLKLFSEIVLMRWIKATTDGKHDNVFSSSLLILCCTAFLYGVV